MTDNPGKWIAHGRTMPHIERVFEAAEVPALLDSRFPPVSFAASVDDTIRAIIERQHKRPLSKNESAALASLTRLRADILVGKV